jgi:hypothetical protein
VSARATEYKGVTYTLRQIGIPTEHPLNGERFAGSLGLHTADDPAGPDQSNDIASTATRRCTRSSVRSRTLNTNSTARVAATTSHPGILGPYQPIDEYRVATIDMRACKSSSSKQRWMIEKYGVGPNSGRRAPALLMSSRVQGTHSDVLPDAGVFEVRHVARSPATVYYAVLPAEGTLQALSTRLGLARAILSRCFRSSHGANRHSSYRSPRIRTAR